MEKIKLRDEVIYLRPSGSQELNLCFLKLSLGLQPKGTSVSGWHTSDVFQQSGPAGCRVRERRESFIQAIHSHPAKPGEGSMYWEALGSYSQ